LPRRFAQSGPLLGNAASSSIFLVSSTLERLAIQALALIYGCSGGFDSQRSALPSPRHELDFFLRAGGGVSVRVSDRYWVEPAFRFAHISNGLGFDSGNPGWQGRELSIGIRRTFRPYQETERKTTLPVSGEANDKEKAWITSAEYYWATPGCQISVLSRTPGI
jgi:hypothetical protein